MLVIIIILDTVKVNRQEKGDDSLSAITPFPKGGESSPFFLG
jgi:hypothetical protein